MDLEQLKYPIGKFEGTRPATAVARGECIARICALPGNLRAAVAGLGDAQLDTPYRDGGWSVRQLGHHVADSHLNAYARVKFGLTEENHVIKAYNQSSWVATPDAALPVEVSLNLLEALHAKWAMLLERISAEQFDRKLTHPERAGQDLDLKWLLGLYSWHGEHHTAHILKLRERMGW